jgi:hypothetical protein
MHDVNHFYESIILDSLKLDLESYELLKDTVRDACGETDIDFNESVFQDLLIEMVKSGKVVPCLYDQSKKHWQKGNFKLQELSMYWFKLN